MNHIMRILLFLSSFQFSFQIININITSPQGIISKEATALLGTSTSSFPNEAFLNFLLYGHSDVLFKYKDFLTEYGINVSTPSCQGCLVLGLDAKIGGIGIGNNQVAIPIPQDKIVSISTQDRKSVV